MMAFERTCLAGMAIAAVLHPSILCADHFVWLGDANTKEPVFQVEWSNASLWTNITASVGNVCPGDEDTVEFRSCPPYSTEYDVTPPASFKGVVIGEKSSGYDRWFYPRINISVAEGAQYKIDGSSTFVASAGLANLLSDTFVGTIEVPSDVEFEIPSSVSKKVKFVGTGTVVPAKKTQLLQVAGINGTIDLRKIEDLNATDLEFLAGHRLILPANAVFDTDGMARVCVDIEDWNVSGCWGVKGAHSEAEKGNGTYKSYAHYPQVLDDGSLLMTDDFGQRNVAWFKKRTFGYDDIWQIKFSYQATHPKDAHPMELPSGTYARGAYGTYFGMVVSASPDGIPVQELASSGSSKMPASSYGIRFYNYGSKPNVAKVMDGAGSNVSDSYASVILDSRAGISQRTAPVDVEVSMNRGVMYICYSQNGNSRSFTVDCANIFKDDITKRYTLGFFANTEDGTWQYAKVSNFKGWCLSNDAGQWKEVESCRITPNNWVLNAYSDGMEEENKVAPASLVSENGDYKFLMGKVSYLASATGQTRLDPAKKYRVEFDLKWGASANMGNVMNMGFVNTPSVKTNDTITNYQVNQSLYSPAVFTYHYYNDLIGFTNGGNTDNASRFSYGCVAGSGLRGNNHAAKCAICYDGGNMLVGSFVSTTSINFRVDIAAKFKKNFTEYYPDGMYFHCGGANGGNPKWKCYLETDICGFKVLEWNGATPAQKWNGGIWVAENKTATLSLGNVNMESVQMEQGSSLKLNAARNGAAVSIGKATVGSGASITAEEGMEVELGGLELIGNEPYTLQIAGDVSFSDSAVVTIPSAWKSSLAPITIMNFTDGAVPEGLTVVLDDGKVLSSRQVLVSGGTLRVNLHLGTCITIR